MSPPTITPQHIRTALLVRDEIALLDVRHEADFATGHPLFAANMAYDRIALEAELRLPRKTGPIVVFDNGEGLVAKAAEALAKLGYSNIRALAGGLKAWRDAGYELFIDVNSYAKAFGELVEHRRHTPSLPADDVAALIESGANIRILDVRRFDEYTTMNIPGSISVPGAELVLRAGHAAPDPATTIVVNCAGRTRSIIGTQSLINAGVPNKVVALRNGTMGWTLASHTLDHGASKRGRSGRSRRPRPTPATSPIAPACAASVWTISARCRRRPRARCTASTYATPRNTPVATSRASVTIPVASWCRRSTSPHPCAARVSCSRTITASAPT
jgi:rhodanese-related sulfurtransferase